MTAAQQEFNELIRDNDVESRHPEDRHNNSDHSDHADSEPEHYYEKGDTDDELDIPHDMRSSNNYYLPQIRSDANTGPKGVIADAHSFEQAKKQARRFTWKKNSPPTTYHATAYHDEKAGSDIDGEDSFMQQWRENRLKELQTVTKRIRSRTTSPSGRRYGTFDDVDAAGFLEAINPKNCGNSTVVVIVYDDRSENFRLIDDAMRELADRHKSTHFVKMHNDDAELELAGVPALLAYRDDDLFQQMVPLVDALPNDSHITWRSIQTALVQRRIVDPPETK